MTHKISFEFWSKPFSDWLSTSMVVKHYNLMSILNQMNDPTQYRNIVIEVIYE